MPAAMQTSLTSQASLGTASNSKLCLQLPTMTTSPRCTWSSSIFCEFM